MGEYSPAKTGEYPRIFPNFYNRWIINTIASIWLRKYARKVVLGHYLFLEVHSFLPASLSENCSHLGTDNVRGQISEHIFAQNEGYCLYIKIRIFKGLLSMHGIEVKVELFADDLTVFLRNDGSVRHLLALIS